MEESFEVVNPKRMLAASLEDPIRTYDSAVTQMTTDGNAWAPPDQMSLKASQVRWAAPEPATSSHLEVCLLSNFVTFIHLLGWPQLLMD